MSMKYFLLAQWVKENASLKGMIEEIVLSDDNVCFRFPNGQNLVFVYKTANPFLFLTQNIPASENESVELWPQLKQGELSLPRIAENDRIIYFTITHKDIYAGKKELQVVFEAMPPQGNLLLCRSENDKLIIQDALVKYTYAENPKRQILSGWVYEPPATDFKPDTEEVNYPLSVKSKLDDKNVLCSSVNEYFQTYFNLVFQPAELLARKEHLLAYWQNELKKAEKKLQLQEREELAAEQEITWLTYAELIKVNLHNIKKGDSALTTVNYYDPELQQVTIPLEKDKSPQENLQLYLKKYRKAKSGKEKTKEQIRKTKKEIAQIKSILHSFSDNSWQDLIPLHSAKTKPAKTVQALAGLFRIPVSEQWEIVIGRKATENDFITTQIARPQDWWFHARIYHGSHVLLRNYAKQEPPEKLIEICCGLAAWFSKAKHSQNVPVDYTQIRYVRKPRKSPPGFVTYTNHKTMFVNPLDARTAKSALEQYGK